jgi:hypothetical protein
LVRIEEYKRKHLEMSFRVLNVFKKLETIRNRGYPLRPEEEEFRNRLEQLILILNKPGQLNGKLKQLMVKCDSLQIGADTAEILSRVRIDGDHLEKIHRVLLILSFNVDSD